jgi:GNAT superfamily N-acetyltransferase
MLVCMQTVKIISKPHRAGRQEEPLFFRTKFEVSISHDDHNPSDFITVYHGIIIEMMTDEHERTIGKLTLYIVERGRVLNDGISLFEVMDCLDGDSCDCFGNLFDSETEELKPKVDRVLSEDRAIQADIMLINRLELEPQYRGRGIGKEVTLRVIQNFGANCGVITCIPIPLQFTGLGPKDRRPKGKRLAQQRVRAFWEGVGFVRLPGSHYYIWPD